MARYRTGLQKRISSIFDGVPLPRSDGKEPRSYAPPTERPSYQDFPRGKDGLAGTATAPKPPVRTDIPAPRPKPQQPKQPPLKVAPAKRAKADTATKIGRQIPWQQALEKIKNKLFTPRPGVDSARQKTIVILVPVLSIVLIFMFIRAFSGPPRKASRPESFGPTNAIAASSSKAEWQKPAPYPTTLRDPMQFGSLTTTQTESGVLIVKGIVYSVDNPSAVINNQIVHEGDKVLDVTIVTIDKDSIEFEMNGKRWTQKVQR